MSKGFSAQTKPKCLWNDEKIVHPLKQRCRVPKQKVAWLMEEEEEEEKKAECNSAGEESRVPQCLGISNERLVVNNAAPGTLGFCRLSY